MTSREYKKRGWSYGLESYLKRFQSVIRAFSKRFQKVVRSILQSKKEINAVMV